MLVGTSLLSYQYLGWSDFSSDEEKTSTSNSDEVEKKDAQVLSTKSINTCSSGNCLEENNKAFKRLTKEQFSTIDSRIEARRSPLHRNGVFVKRGMTIPAFTVVTYYDGIKELYNHLNTSPAPTSRVYCVRVGKFTINAQNLVDCSGEETKDLVPLAHLINSCHPALPKDYRTPNCKFICVDVVSEDENGVMANVKEVSVMTTKTLESDEELLVDYHWILSYHTYYKATLLVCNCSLCIPNVTSYYRNRSYLEEEQRAMETRPSKKRRKL